MKKLVYIVFLVLTVCSCRTRTVYMPVETKILDSVVFHDTTFQERLVRTRIAYLLPIQRHSFAIRMPTAMLHLATGY